MQQVTTIEDFAVLVRARRRDLGWSQAFLADKLGVSRQWIIDMEKGKPRAELALSLALLEALGIELKSLWRQTSSKAERQQEQGEAVIRALADEFDFFGK